LFFDHYFEIWHKGDAIMVICELARRNASAAGYPSRPRRRTDAQPDEHGTASRNCRIMTTLERFDLALLAHAPRIEPDKLKNFDLKIYAMTDHTLILNVDDNPGALHAKTRLLMNAGFRVEEATDGADALAMVAELMPDLVLLDVKLPDINGREVCRRIKTDPATADIFVLQVSAALISPEDKKRGLHSGADQYVTAPFEPSDLVANVRALLRHNE
jgi:CheY-like chemotaxis protein